MGDLLKKRFGRLLVVKKSHVDHHSNCYWDCLCDCGETTTVRGDHLPRGDIKSCGCLSRDFPPRLKHGHTVGLDKGLKQTSIYGSWQSMIQRCENPNVTDYKYWGGSGVKVHSTWRASFEQFVRDMGPKPEGTTLDRWPDPYGNYEKGNCRWATSSQQRLNRRKTGAA